MNPTYALLYLTELPPLQPPSADRVVELLSDRVKGPVTHDRHLRGRPRAPGFDQRDRRGRLGGSPFGVDADSWPYRGEQGDEPFDHISTLDLEDVPSFRSRFRDDVRAMSLFVQNPDFNEAWRPHNDQITVQILSEEDVVDGPFDGDLPSGGDRPFRSTDAREVEVPAAIFEADSDDRLPVAGLGRRLTDVAAGSGVPRRRFPAAIRRELRAFKSRSLLRIVSRAFGEKILMPDPFV